MKILVSILAVVAIAIAAAFSSAADVQTLSNAQANQFIGGCFTPCVDPWSWGEDCQQCIDLPGGSKRFNMGDWALLCHNDGGIGTTCSMTGVLTCGTSGNGGKWLYYNTVDDCSGDYDSSIPATYEIQTAAGDNCP